MTRAAIFLVAMMVSWSASAATNFLLNAATAPGRRIAVVQPGPADPFLSDVAEIVYLDLATPSNLLMGVKMSPGGTYSVQSADVAGAAKATRWTFTTGAGSSYVTNWWTDTNAVVSTAQRFYQVAYVRGGVSGTNPAEWGMLRQNMPNSQPNLIGIPVDYGSDGDNNLKGAYGRQLARCLHGETGSVMSAGADKAYYYDGPALRTNWLHVSDDGSATNWWNRATGTNEDYVLPAGAGVFVSRLTGARGMTQAVYCARIWTNCPPVAFSNRQVMYFGWPWPKSISVVNQGTNTPADPFGFVAVGATPGTTASLVITTTPPRGDDLWVWKGTVWQQCWLLGSVNPVYNNRWWDQGAGNYASISLDWGRGYSYQHRSTNDPVLVPPLVIYWTPPKP